ncbi:MAG TPA: SRPBCC family protein [Devosiaceae bacterium]|jgi:uncharacterized protein YndB with AHSA1/START domain|nr:SRPBCC family protein [Devosiaceae bacterium]
MSEHSVAHGTFVIERDFPHPVAKVFAAWADPRRKYSWFGGPGENPPPSVFEFRPGGRESSSGQAPDGPNYSFDVIYQDIVPENRILYTYDMHLDGRKISVSLAAIEFAPSGDGTHLTLTEYGLYLDGLDNVEQRRQGTMHLIGQLGDYLDRQ